MKHQCQRNKWIHGHGWGCNDCDPAIVAQRQAEAVKLQAEHANKDKTARDEYKYALAEAKRRHPEWTLRERQAYARRSAQSLFE